MVLPGTSIGRYLVKRKLAEGGMAELFLCTAVGPEGFEKEVVIKRIKAFLSSDPSFIEMFKAEARLASRLNHANVVQIFDFDKHDDAWFIAMEYVYGASLWELRRRCRELAMPFPPLLVAEIGAQVARGLQYAHTVCDKGKPLSLVHRDVTPHNVLLSFDGGVKLTDFGIAKAGTSFTAPGMLKGKFAYMSPEQARGEKVDARTDIFALGITLWEMLTGGRLFEGDSDIAVLRAVQESLIAPPARLNPEVPTELSEVVLKALSRPVDQRFQTAHELERALANFVLKNSTSTDDANIGLFLRQMFRDELEEAERAATSEHAFTGSDASQTPIVDGYAIGDTRHVNRFETQQTATPAPASDERPKTAQMPGHRPSGRLSPLMDPDDGASGRTDQVEEFVPPSSKEKTTQMPGLRSSRKLPPVAEPPRVDPGAVTASTTGIARSPPVELERPGHDIPAGEVENELPKKTVLPWLLAACVGVGLICGLGFAVNQARRPASPPTPTVVEVPIAPAVEARAAPQPAELAAALGGAPAKKEEPPPAAREPPAVTAAEPRRTSEAAKPNGFLLIDANPFAELFINNKKFADIVGKERIPLAPGTYGLRFEHPKLVTTETVTVKAGQSVSVKFRPMAK